MFSISSFAVYNGKSGIVFSNQFAFRPAGSPTAAIEGNGFSALIEVIGLTASIGTALYCRPIFMELRQSSLRYNIHPEYNHQYAAVKPVGRGYLHRFQKGLCHGTPCHTTGEACPTQHSTPDL